MKQLSPSTNFCVLRHGPSWSALSPKKSVLSASSVARFAIFSPRRHFPDAPRDPVCSATQSRRIPTPTPSLHPISIRPASAARAASFKRLYRTRAEQPAQLRIFEKTRVRYSSNVYEDLTVQMSRAPPRHDRSDAQARRLHLNVRRSCGLPSGVGLTHSAVALTAWTTRPRETTTHFRRDRRS